MRWGLRYLALCAQYAQLSPYFALWAQYGLWIALFRPMGSIRALGRPISPYGLNTGSRSPYFAL